MQKVLNFIKLVKFSTNDYDRLLFALSGKLPPKHQGYRYVYKGLRAGAAKVDFYKNQFFAFPSSVATIRYLQCFLQREIMNSDVKTIPSEDKFRKFICM